MTERREILPELTLIHERLRRGALVKLLSTGSTESGVEHLERAVYNRPTNIARSETLTTSEEVKSLKDKLSSIRDWVMGHGEWVEEGKERYWSHSIGMFQVSADEATRPDSIEPLHLVSVLLWEVPDDEIAISFGFNDDFQLEITFEDKDNQGYRNRYDSANRPLGEMTDEESKIITYYLGQYCKMAQIPVEEDPTR